MAITDPCVHGWAPSLCVRCYPHSFHAQAIPPSTAITIGPPEKGHPMANPDRTAAIAEAVAKEVAPLDLRDQVEHALGVAFITAAVRAVFRVLDAPVVQPGRYPEAVIEEAAERGWIAVRALSPELDTFNGMQGWRRRELICEAGDLSRGGVTGRWDRSSHREAFRDAVLAHLRAWDGEQAKPKGWVTGNATGVPATGSPDPIPDAGPVSDEELKQAGWTRDVDGGGWWLGRRPFSRHRAEIVERACRARELAGRIAGLEWALKVSFPLASSVPVIEAEIARLRRG